MPKYRLYTIRQVGSQNNSGSQLRRESKYDETGH